VPRRGLPAHLLRDIHAEWRKSPLWGALPGKRSSEIISDAASNDSSQPSNPDTPEAVLCKGDSFGSRRPPKFASEGAVLESSYGRLGRSYEGKGVARITRTILALWNAGDQTIDVDDVENGFAFRMSGPILAWNCYGIRPENARVDQNGADCLTLSVAKLAPGDGVCLELIHSGEIPKASCVGVTRARRRVIWQVVGVLLDIGGSLASSGGQSPTTNWSPFFSWRRFGIPRDVLGQLDSGQESELL
jgi:hypothetical protein